MIPEYINKWLEIIEKMSNTTTYKLAWGRAIIESIIDGKCQKYDEDNSFIDIEDISFNVLRYYWNQYYFFKLRQAGGAARNKSTIMDEVIRLIEVYQKITEKLLPEWFDKAIDEIIKKDLKAYQRCINKISNNLLLNPCTYFMHVGGDKYNNVYTKYKNKIIIGNSNISQLKEYSSILILILNYRWSQLLEDYNSAPKITQKVARAAQNKIRRKNLSHFIKYLVLASNNKAIDFYTGQEIEAKEISVDHVIPWSYMYSDDIWNLVLTTKKFNSSKNNSIPSREAIDKLNKRNKELLDSIDEEKYKLVLKEAIENNYVDKFYNNCKYDFVI